MNDLDNNIISKYWDTGWKKRNHEISDFTSFKIDQLKIYAEKRLKFFRRKKKFGSLFSNEINFDDFHNKELLNIGCGTGLEANMFLCFSSVNLTAIDISSEAVFNTQRILDTHQRGRAIRASAELMPFENNSFDFVYTSGVLHHAESIENCIEEIHRVLKPGGSAFIGLYSTTGISFIYKRIKSKIISIVSKKKSQDIFSNLTDTDWNVGSSKTPISRTFTKNEILILLKNFNVKSVRRGNFSSEVFRTTLLSKKIFFIGFILFKIIKLVENQRFFSFIGDGIYSVAIKKKL